MTLPVRNSAYNFAGQVISIVVAFVCIPIAFRNLGVERFGLLSLAWSLLSYAIVFDLGTGPAVARATAASLATDAGRRIAAILRAGLTIQIGLGIAAGLIIAGFAPNLLTVLRIPESLHQDATRSTYVVAAALPVVLVAQSFQAVLEGLERFDLIAWLRTPVAAATFAFPAYGAVAGWPLWQMMLAILCARIAGVLMMYAAYARSLPADQSGMARDELGGLFRYGRWLAVTGVLTQLITYIDRFLLSALHGLTAVAHYAPPYDAASKLLVLPGAVGVAMFPGMAKDAARDRAAESVTRSRAAVRFVLLVLVPVCLLLGVFAPQLLRLWLGPDFGPQGTTAFRILLLATLLHAASYAPVILIEAVGRSAAVARYHLIELLAYLPVVILAIMEFGIAGAAWAWVARSAALLLWSSWYAQRIS